MSSEPAVLSISIRWRYCQPSSYQPACAPSLDVNNVVAAMIMMAVIDAEAMTTRRSNVIFGSDKPENNQPMVSSSIRLNSKSRKRIIPHYKGIFKSSAALREGWAL